MEPSWEIEKGVWLVMRTGENRVRQAGEEAPTTSPTFTTTRLTYVARPANRSTPLGRPARSRAGPQTGRTLKAENQGRDGADQLESANWNPRCSKGPVFPQTQNPVNKGLEDPSRRPKRKDQPLRYGVASDLRSNGCRQSVPWGMWAQVSVSGIQAYMWQKLAGRHWEKPR